MPAPRGRPAARRSEHPNQVVMIRLPVNQPAVRREPFDPRAVDRQVCQGLRAHMVELEERGWELNWPVVRGKRDGESVDLRIESPYFFLNERPAKGFKQTSAARRVPPTRAGRLRNHGFGDQFVAAMRNPDSKAVDLLLYADGVLLFYRNAMSRKESVESLAARPADPEAHPAFVEGAVKAAESCLKHYLVRAEKPSLIRLHRDILSRKDVARNLSEQIAGAGCGYTVLDLAVERVANDLGVAKRVNDQGYIEQLDFLLRMVGEVRTRTIVRRCIEATTARPRRRRRGRRAVAALPAR